MQQRGKDMQPIDIILVAVGLLVALWLYRKRQSQKKPDALPKRSPITPKIVVDRLEKPLYDNPIPEDGLTEQPAANSELGVVVIDDKILRISDFPAGSPKDILRLAARNRAFFEALYILHQRNLDEDLYLEAIEDLRKKYNREPASS